MKNIDNFIYFRKGLSWQRYNIETNEMEECDLLLFFNEDVEFSKNVEENIFKYIIQED